MKEDCSASPSRADYASTGLFTVYYTDANIDSVVARFRVDLQPRRGRSEQRADAAVHRSAERRRLHEPQGRHRSHTGRTASCGSPRATAAAPTIPRERAESTEPARQDAAHRRGPLLRARLDPGQRARSIGSRPTTRSWARAPRDEIWALGLRNPFRWSFDRATGDLWIGDVGQDALEEVDFEPVTDPGGRNYGWDVMEGAQLQPERSGAGASVQRVRRSPCPCTSTDTARATARSSAAPSTAPTPRRCAVSTSSATSAQARSGASIRRRSASSTARRSSGAAAA